MSEHKVLLELETQGISQKESSRLLIEFPNLPEGLKVGDILEWDIEVVFMGAEDLKPEVLNGRWLLSEVVWRNEGEEWLKVFRVNRMVEGYE